MKMNFTEFKDFIKDFETISITDDTVFNISTDSQTVNYYFYLWREKKKRYENRNIPFYKYCKWKNAALGIVGKNIKKRQTIELRRCRENEHRHYRL